MDWKKIKTEERNERTANIDTLSTLDMVRLINDEDKKVALAVEKEAERIAAAVDVIAAQLKEGGRLIYCGCGTSGRLGVLDAVECPPTFGVTDQEVIGLIAGGEGAFVKAKEGAEDDEAQGGRDLDAIGLTARDTVIGLTASGRTPYVLGALRRAREAGCRTAAISCNRGARASALADAAVEVHTGPEVLSGSTRLKAGTAQKMILNMISTASMVGVGKVYQNLMVDVRQTNQKLVRRAENIVMQSTGCTWGEAAQALREAGGEAKPAVVKLLLGTDIETARRLLDRAEGSVRRAVAEQPCVKGDAPSTGYTQTKQKEELK